MLPGYPVVPGLNSHRLIILPILISFHRYLAQANVSPERYLEDLLLEFIVVHKLLNGDEVPPVEQCLMELLDIGHVQGLDESEVWTIGSIFNSRQSNDNFEVPVIREQQARLQLVYLHDV